MFFDWLAVSQEFDYELPIIGPRAYQNIEVDTGEAGKLSQPRFQHEGSFSTSISISISGGRLTVSGNPSRYSRLDNLFGFTSLDDCFRVYNNILRGLGLPEFTKCTRVWQLSGEDGSKVRTFTDGAVIKEVHITSNRAVGVGCVDDYIKGVSSLNYRNSIPRLHTNGKTCDWLSPKGNANLIYPSVYNKAFEIRLHHLDKVKRCFGEDSKEFNYVSQVADYCEQHGVARFEQKLKGRYLQRQRLNHWGLFDESSFKPIHDEFLSIDEKLQVTSMTFENISERLMSVGVVDTTRAANTTAMYAINWMHGQQYDCVKSQEKTHRARLRKIGIDIKQQCNISRFSPVYVVKAKEVVVSDLNIPSWYERASSAPRLSLVS